MIYPIPYLIGLNELVVVHLYKTKLIFSINKIKILPVKSSRRVVVGCDISVTLSKLLLVRLSVVSIFVIADDISDVIPIEELSLASAFKSRNVETV
jgi:hypothetical protein